MDRGFNFTFPAIRGFQATHEYYVAMCPLRVVPKLLVFDDIELEPQLRAQRILNKARIPALCNYIINNPTDYVFSALTASIDGDVEFLPVSDDVNLYNIGHLKVPMTARFVINDGQHRRAAIEEALKRKPKLGTETIACVFFIDLGLRRSQQMFADLNRHAVRPTQSLNILFDHRDSFSQVVKGIIERVPVFSDTTELDKTNISNRSPHLFTLSGIYRGTQELLGKKATMSNDEQLATAVSFWEAVSAHVPQWHAVKNRTMLSSDLRRDYLHAHTVALVALGRMGSCLLDCHPDNWCTILERLSLINWRRDNPIWEGRAIIGGKVQISRLNITLLCNVLKRTLDLPLSEEEQAAEDALAVARGEKELHV